MKNNKEQEILKAAEKLFAEKGFKNATTTLIAAEAGVNHAMLHYYFRTKDQIFLKVLDGYMKEIWENLRGIMVPDTYDVKMIGDVTELVFNFIDRHRGQMSLFIEVAKDRPDLLETYVSESGRYLSGTLNSHRERIDRAIKEGSFKKITFQELLVDIFTVCSAPFMMEPLLDNILKMDDKRRASFLESRKREAVELITGRIRADKNNN